MLIKHYNLVCKKVIKINFCTMMDIKMVYFFFSFFFPLWYTIKSDKNEYLIALGWESEALHSGITFRLAYYCYIRECTKCEKGAFMLCHKQKKKVQLTISLLAIFIYSHISVKTDNTCSIAVFSSPRSTYRTRDSRINDSWVGSNESFQNSGVY